MIISCVSSFSDLEFSSGRRQSEPITFYTLFMENTLEDESLMEEIENDRLRLRIAREQAEELVRDRGWTENDEDFWFQVEEEAKRQWDEEYEREFWKRYGPEDFE